MQVLISGTNALFVTDAAFKFVKERKNGERKEKKKEKKIHNQKQVKSEHQKAHFTLRSVQKVYYFKQMLKVVPKFAPIQQTLITLCAVLGKHRAFIPTILNILTVYSLTQHKPEILA